jgi:hypothetical protein
MKRGDPEGEQGQGTQSSRPLRAREVRSGEERRSLIRFGTTLLR